ncbi:MAG: hypothetical protein M0Z98_06390 [Actinomycetales bacterium]|nr:hypothetical protein [Actinomycetales bacterium]
MRRLFWLSVGAAAGYYAARKGTVAVEQARERGLVGNVTLVAGTASRLAATASRTTLAVGEAVGSRARALADVRGAERAAPGPTAASNNPSTPTTSTPGPTTPTSSREVRP